MVRKLDNQNIQRSQQPQESPKKGVPSGVSSLANKVHALPPTTIDMETKKHTYSLNPKTDKAKMAQCFTRTFKK
jgi:hypothetical protein